MSIERHLILVHTPEWQDAADFEAIAQRVEQLAPDIRTFVVSNNNSAPVTKRRAAELPTMVFSPIRLGAFRPRRGHVFEGQTVSKLIEMKRLSQAGLPVPPFTALSADTRLDPAVFGPHVVIKPSYALASFGQGIELWPVDQAPYRHPDEWPAAHPGRHGPMIAQKFIDCGEAMTCRVLTLFGAPLLSYCRHSTVPLALETLSFPCSQDNFMPMRPNMRVYAPDDADILALAARAYDAFPEAALQACDILRDRDGDLHLLEINPGGGTWMFSNRSAPFYREALELDDLTTMFNAFDVAAMKLVEKTRAMAN